MLTRCEVKVEIYCYCWLCVLPKFCQWRTGPPGNREISRWAPASWSFSGPRRSCTHIKLRWLLVDWLIEITVTTLQNVETKCVITMCKEGWTSFTLGASLEHVKCCERQIFWRKVDDQDLRPQVGLSICACHSSSSSCGLSRGGRCRSYELAPCLSRHWMTYS